MKLQLKRVKLSLSEFMLELDVTITSRVTALCGPSGAGKTSLLEVIAGLRSPQSAFIQLDDRVFADTVQGLDLPARERRVGYVPQDFALFPHLSVQKNLLYGYKSEQKSNGGELFSYRRVTEVLEIESLIQRSIASLSGGEKQRVALGRALLSSPELLLLDEPLASLDRELSRKILQYLKRVRDEFHLPMLFVSHHLEDVLPLCDAAFQLERGQITLR